jgi:hypothetical protein
MIGRRSYCEDLGRKLQQASANDDRSSTFRTQIKDKTGEEFHAAIFPTPAQPPAMVAIESCFVNP